LRFEISPSTLRLPFLHISSEAFVSFDLSCSALVGFCGFGFGASGAGLLFSYVILMF